MHKPWYRSFFLSATQSDPTLTRANAGEADAQFSLGLKFATAEGPAKDYLQAADWYRKAADQGHSLAQFNLGVMYSAGQGMQKDSVTALMWFHKAAVQGDAGAQYNLGMSHYQASLWGPSAEALEAKKEAYKWFTLADAKGYKDSVGSCESLNLSMTREEVADGNLRAAAFLAANPAAN
jgi:TPR repeat protein